MSDDTSEIVERVTRGWAEGSPDVLLGIACREIESLRKQRDEAVALYMDLVRRLSSSLSSSPPRAAFLDGGASQKEEGGA